MTTRDRIVELVRVRAGDLIDNEKNWRKHPRGQVKAMRGVLEEVGYAAALIARQTDAGLELIDGHLRAGLDENQEVPVLIVDLDAAESDLVLATLDPIANMARTDRETFAALLAGIEAESDAVKDLLEAAGKESMPGKVTTADLSDVPERVKTGELWKLGDHRLICGDATDVKTVARLFGRRRASALVTDPPYQVGYGKGRSGIKGARAKDWSEFYVEQKADSGFLSGFLAAGLTHLTEDARLFVWMANVSMCELKAAFFANDCVPHQEIIWRKQHPVRTRRFYSISRYEAALMGWRKGHDARKQRQGNLPPGALDDLWEIDAVNNDRSHPTEKPLECMARPMRDLTDRGDIVYEPFAGSGTTIEAAETEGRKCYALELSPRFCDVILVRWESLGGKAPKLA
ncbi:MAG: hypothetical protein A2W26_04955 [Acidobacteria bacterium RBG_16_64_8]|nr:MAG: hypothetical protein A2W26_04955 [Acidobacteria bacterium RBG_16_64_8]